MTITATCTPTYPVPNRQVKVMFAGAGGSWLRVWCTVAPTGSEEDTALKADTTANRVQVYEGDAGVTPWYWTPTASGKYTLKAQAYTRGTSYGGGYAGDPNAAPTETPVGAEETVYLYVGQRLKTKLGYGADTADLIVWVWNDTIRPTTFDTHGEVSPRVDLGDNPTDKARSAAEHSGVVGAVAALSNMVASTCLGTLSTTLADMVSKINAHLALGSTTHNAADTDNKIAVGHGSAPTPASLPASMTAILRALRQHMTNDKGGGPDSATSVYHKVGGANVNDLTNLPLMTSAADVGEAYAALGDVFRSYEAHRVNTAVHGAADNTNSLAGMWLIATVHSLFIGQLAALSPTPPATAHSGAVLLVAQAGFEEG
jgi:hypothetical protein